MDVITVGSRASALAKQQAREWLALVEPRLPGVRIKRRLLTEGGDRDRTTSTLAEVARTAGGSAFSSDQERALVEGDVDVVVHSLKDLPTTLAAGTRLLTTPGPRQDVADVLCGATLDGLPEGARVGTGAPRRIAQLLHLRPDLDVVPIRGNVPTRLRHVGRGGMHAVVLASAGLNRLGMLPPSGRRQVLDPSVFPPSPGQGALGVQVRAGSPVEALLAGTGDVGVDACVRAERALLAELHGGCSVPVGAWGRIGPEGDLVLSAAVTAVDGSRQVTASGSGPVDAPEKLGGALAAELLALGAREILVAVRR
ncbi:hydroxymethylbilane synthase [Streptomyces sp. NRRL S-87]|uniref:hydroxymethylbilane synthase n=1 Tax=Streptomyces sp. NRRL S-87 TaxID=1463920 RepID=UPI0004C2A481|nr:hydroxymethylbilane synthase [Streptomyces sp. NRRL S-87]